MFSQVILPSKSDSLIAGRTVNFIFDTKVLALHSVSVSLGDSHSWFWLVRQNPSGNLEWQLPLQDIDSISFNYLGKRFYPPRKIGEITFAHSAEVTSVDFSSDSYLFLTSGQDGKIFVWDLQSQAKIDSLVLSAGRVYNAKFFGDSNTIVFAHDTMLSIWNRNTGDIEQITAKKGIVRALAVNNTKQLIAFGSYDGSFEVLDSNFNNLLYFQDDTQIYSTEFSSNGELVACGDYNGKAFVFNLFNDEQIFSFNTSYDSNLKNVVWSLAFSESDSLLATAGIDGKIRIWNLGNGVSTDSFPNHLFHIREVFFSRNEQILTSASLDSSLRQIYYPRKFEIHSPLKERSSIISLGFSRDEKYFVVGLRNGTVSIWKNYEIEEFQEKWTMPYFIPMIAKSFSFEIFPNEVKYVPIFVQNPLQIEFTRFAFDSSYAIARIPFEHFGILDNTLNRFVVKKSDTISSQLETIRSIDTFAILYIWSFTPTQEWGKFYLEKINFRGKINLLWTLQEDSIHVVERCKPLQDLNRFELIYGLDFEFFPNPTSDKIYVKIFGDNNSFVNIKLVDCLGREIKLLFKGLIQNRVTELEFKVGDVVSGAYSLVMEYDGQKVAKKLIILR